MLHLPAPPALADASRPRIWTATELLYLFSKEEQLHGENAVYCEACGGKRYCRRQLRVARQPNVLFVRVGRAFCDAHGRQSKLRYRVVPERELSFTSAVMAPPFGQVEQASCSELAAVVYHEGSAVSMWLTCVTVTAHPRKRLE